MYGIVLLVLDAHTLHARERAREQVGCCQGTSVELP